MLGLLTHMVVLIWEAAFRLISGIVSGVADALDSFSLHLSTNSLSK